MSSSKRHFTAVIGKKEQGTYTSSSPSSAARKAVSKLCADDKNRKVEFYMRETTQSSGKKVYGPYIGYIEKLKKPIELKGRIIRYKPVAKLLKNKKMSGGMFTIHSYLFDSMTNEYMKILLNKLKELETTPLPKIIPKVKVTNQATLEQWTPNPTNENRKLQRQKELERSGTFIINESGVHIANNIKNFSDIMNKVKQALDNTKIKYDPEVLETEID
jgi:hypothetical protein